MDVGWLNRSVAKTGALDRDLARPGRAEGLDATDWADPGEVAIDRVPDAGAVLRERPGGDSHIGQQLFPAEHSLGVNGAGDREPLRERLVRLQHVPQRG